MGFLLTYRFDHRIHPISQAYSLGENILSTRSSVPKSSTIPTLFIVEQRAGGQAATAAEH